MIRIDDVILSEDIATAQFACNISRCKGACCVVGDAGAPVDKNEIPILRKAFNKLKHKLSLEAVEIAEEDGVILGNSEEGYEINCIDSGECIFVEKRRAILPPVLFRMHIIPMNLTGKNRLAAIFILYA